ncbi:MAG: sulfatase [Draconibacterium sp.]|nr:sulfatase [Draconibacterium sp.]
MNSNLKYLFIFIVAFLISGYSEKDKQYPNILFILADDMGWQDTSVPFFSEVTKFNKRFHTPALERLAAEGVKFSQAYSCSVCSPSRVSLLTGMNAARHGVTQWTYLSGDKPTSDINYAVLSPANWNWNGLQPEPGINNSVSVPTLPQLLKKAGYRTMHFGKGHLGAANTPGADPKYFSFDIRIGGRDAGGCGSYWGTKNFGAKAHPNGPWRAWDLDMYFGQDIHLTEALTLEAKREIRQSVKKGQPFFCYFAHYAPHTPIEPDERFAQTYRNAGLDDNEAAYASLIQGMDKSVGDLLELINELDVADNTIVVFTSDNGGVSHKYRTMDPKHTHNAPLSSGKGSHHEGGIRVPLLVKWGNKFEQVCIETPVMIYDWFPTLLDVAGLKSDSEIDGKSLLPILNGIDSKDFERPLIWHFPNFWGPLQNTEPVKGPGMGPCSAIRKGDWKLIYYHANKKIELFNLKEDLGEKNNQFQNQPEIAKELALELSTYLKECNAPMPIEKSTGIPVSFPTEILKNIN